MKIEPKRFLSFAVAFHRMSSINNLIVSASSFSTTSTSIPAKLQDDNHAFNPDSESPNNYLSLPNNMKLKKVILFTRHGDRSQISRSVGDNYPENDKLTEFWKSKLPSSITTSKLHTTARILDLELESSDIDGESVSELIKSSEIPNIQKSTNIYAGWDSVNSPYGMLTELGSLQLQNLGKSIRARYFDLLIQNNNETNGSYSSSIYCRSTNMCRTILSLRSFLFGFLQVENTDIQTNYQTNQPIIIRRHKLAETMYPQADGPCYSVAKRREILFADNYLESKTLSNYYSFEKKIKRILGFENSPVNWLVVKEVLTCHTVHGMPLPADITDEDIDKATVIAATMWGRLYNDKELNRLAIGRFIHELVDDIDGNIQDSKNINTNSNTNTNTNVNTNGNAYDSYHENSRKEVAPFANMLIYSGHDSTLVPLLCALGLYKNEWTPYASYLAFEIVERTDSENSSATSVQNIKSGTDKTGDCDVNSNLWVRLIFNDEVQIPIKIISELGPFPTDTEGNSDIDKNKSSTWIPYTKFISYLKSFTVSADEYQSACVDPLKTDESSASQQMQDELRATIGTVSKKTRVN